MREDVKIMSEILVLFYDDKCGIRRVPISDGSFPLGKVGDRLVIAYILDTLNEIFASLNISAEIIIPFPHGVDNLYPQMSPRDLFYHSTTYYAFLPPICPIIGTIIIVICRINNATAFFS